MWRWMQSWFVRDRPRDGVGSGSSDDDEPPRLHGMSGRDSDDDERYLPAAGREETYAVVVNELRRIEAHIGQGEDAIHSCETRLALVPTKVQGLLEELEGILLGSYDDDAYSAYGGEAADAATRIVAQQREVEYERARKAAVRDVASMVASIMTQRDRLAARLVHLQVNLKTLEKQRDRVQSQLDTLTRSAEDAVNDLVPRHQAAPDVMFELEIREAGDAATV